MDYLLCIPARETNTRENCEKIHNVLARMSDTYKLRIVPEPVKNKQFPCPPYYKKYRNPYPCLPPGGEDRPFQWERRGRDALEFLQDGGRAGTDEKLYLCVPVFGGDRT